MRICMISDDFLPATTGVGVHVQTIAAELARRRHDIAVVTCKRPDAPPGDEWKGVAVERVPSLKTLGFYQGLPSARALRGIMLKHRTAIVHYHYLSLMLVRAFKVARELGLRHLYTYHMPVEVLTAPLPMRPFRHLIFDAHVHYCNRFDRILVPAAGLVDTLRHYGITTPVFYLSNPVGFTGADAASSEPSRFTVFYAGRLGVEKNLPFLLAAIARLSAQPGVQVALRIAGDGPLRRELRQEVARLGIQASVEFLGQLDHPALAREYAGCSVFVLPSRLETQGLVAMEAMCFGKPVIVTDAIISARELVDEGHNGFIVELDSVDELADRLLQLHRDADLRRRMGVAGRQKAQRYTVCAIVDELEAHYRQLDSRAVSAAR